MFRVSMSTRQFTYWLKYYAEAMNVSTDEACKKICQRVRDVANEILQEELRWGIGEYEQIKASTPGGKPELMIMKGWRIRREKSGHWTLWNISPHAVYVEYGTGVWGRGSPITPRGMKPLKFRFPDGTWITTYAVAGQPPKAYLSRAITQVKREVGKFVVEEFSKQG